MLNIYPTVKVFSNMNLMNGEKYKAPFYFVSRSFKESSDLIHLAKNISINKKDFSININDKKIPIRRFVKSGYNKKMEFVKDVKFVDFSANLSVIYMAAYNTFLIIDEQTYNSLYIQLMVLEEYDKSLFEQVTSNPHAKVYKLKI